MNNISTANELLYCGAIVNTTVIVKYILMLLTYIVHCDICHCDSFYEITIPVQCCRWIGIAQNGVEMHNCIVVIRLNEINHSLMWTRCLSVSDRWRATLGCSDRWRATLGCSDRVRT